MPAGDEENLVPLGSPPRDPAPQESAGTRDQEASSGASAATESSMVRVKGESVSWVESAASWERLRSGMKLVMSVPMRSRRPT